ncbi:MAG: hypothetical protein PHU46_00530 [Rhodocyclaceae bacterium]|nr:hypothetical protein [Rhodocyclaceae bacterium]
MTFPRWLLLCCLPTLAMAADRVTYCCKDDSGHQVCSDMLPPQCYNKAYREINNRGMTVRNVEPPPSPEQRAAREAEQKRKKAEEQAALEQRRKDSALLATYPGESDIAASRERALNLHRDAIRDSQARLEAAKKKQQSLAREAEFYLKKPMPQELRNSIKDNEAEQKSLQLLIENRQKEMAAVNARFDADLTRFRELNNRSGLGYTTVSPK